jgi:ABC-2 type transport system permease protein
MVLGKTLGSATLAWLQGLIFLLFAPLAGLRISAVSLVEVAAVIFLISITLTLLGFLVAWQMDSAQGFHAIINLALVPLWMVSGSLFTMAHAHGWIKAVMLANPLTYALAALRHVLDPGRGPAAPGLALSLLVTSSCAFVLLIASAAVATRKSTRMQA